jgi:hypothetical protein
VAEEKIIINTINKLSTLKAHAIYTKYAENASTLIKGLKSILMSKKIRYTQSSLQWIKTNKNYEPHVVCGGAELDTESGERAVKVGGESSVNVIGLDVGQPLGETVREIRSRHLG